MSYVKSKKSFEVRGGIFFIILPCAKKTHDNFNILPCAKKSTRKHMALPCAKVKHGFAVCHEFAVCLFVDTRQSCFLRTRQTRWHTANVEFPVALVAVNPPATNQMVTLGLNQK